MKLISALRGKDSNTNTFQSNPRISPSSFGFTRKLGIIPALGIAALLANSTSAQSAFLQYTFDESSGSSVADSISPFNNGQLSGSATHPQAQVDLGVEFPNSGSNYVTTNSSISVNDNTGMSVAVWVRPNSTNSNDPGIIAQQLDGSGTIGRTWLLYGTDGTIGCYVGGAATNGPQLQLGQWHHVVVTAKSGSVKIYVNGVQVVSNNLAVESNTAKFRFGNFKNTGNNWQFKGVLDDLKLYTGALTSTEVDTLYQSYFSTNYDAIIQAGLTAWRKPDVNGSSCADCHGMAGFDLSNFDFDPTNDILRRALNHVNQTEAESIRDMIGALAAKYNVSQDDQFTDRPFQPTGQIVAGSTDTERDLNFGNNLVNANLMLFSGTIDSIADAEAAAQELYDLNVWEIPVGIPFNLVSEDAHHGIAHGTLAEWIPTFPRAPKAGMAQAWYGLHDDYIANPSDANFWAIYHAVETHTEVPASWVEASWQRTSMAAEFGLFEFRSLLLAQHFWLRRAQGIEDTFLDTSKHVQWVNQASQNSDNFIPGDIWHAADLARVIHGGANDFWLLNTDAGFPVREINDMDMSLDKNRHMELFAAPWFYNGWMIDQGMMRTGKANSTKSLEYFIQRTTDHANQAIQSFYPLHIMFAIGKRNTVTRWDPDAWPSTVATSRRDSLLWMQNLRIDSLNNSSYFYNTAHYNLFKKVAENLHSMVLYLAQDDLNNNDYKQYFATSPMNKRIDEVEANLNSLGAMTPALQQIIANLRAIN